MKLILFNNEMVRAILEDRKSRTSRAIKGLYDSLEETAGDYKFCNSIKQVFYKTEKGFIADAKYQIGDILWVGETWAEVPHWETDKCEHTCNSCSQCMGSKAYIYKASNPDANVKWYPSNHMPRDAARIFLRVTYVGVQSIMDVTEQDANEDGFINDEDIYGKGNPPLGDKK